MSIELPDPRPLARDHKIALGLFLAIAFAGMGYVSQAVIQNFPNSADEYAYVFQARNLARFQLYAPIHPAGSDGFRMQDYFYFVHVGETDGKYYGRFPPGYSLLLVPAAWAEMAFHADLFWVVNPLVGTLSLWLVFLFCRRFFDDRVAWASMAVLLFNPWFLLTCGSFFSHTTCAFFIAGSFYLFLRGTLSESRSRRWMLFAGLSFGFAVLVRFLDPLAYLVPFALVYLLLRRHQLTLGVKNFFQDLFWFGLGASVFFVLLVLYNWGLTGNPFLTAYQYYNPDDSGTRFVFLVGDQGHLRVDFTQIEKSFRGTIVDNLNLLKDWDVWIYLLVALPWALWVHRKEPIRVILTTGMILTVPMVVLAYTLYGGPPVNQYGPRYFFTLVVPISVLGGVCFGSLFHGRFGLAAWAPVAVLGIVTCGGTFGQAKSFHDQIYDRTNLFRTVNDAKLHHAVVIVTTDSGPMYTGDLIRNSLAFDNDVIYTQALGGNYTPLVRYYSGYQIYEYKYAAKDQPGKLTRLIIGPEGTYHRMGQEADLTKLTPGTRPGLTGYYYTGTNFDNLVFKRTDPSVDFDWGRTSPDSRLPQENFSIRWQGQVFVPKAGRYTFWTTSDDGVQLMVDEKLVINHWTPHGAAVDQGDLSLDRGWHNLQLNYCQFSYDALVRLEFSSDGLVRQPIPSRDLRSFKEDERP